MNLLSNWFAADVPAFPSHATLPCSPFQQQRFLIALGADNTFFVEIRFIQICRLLRSRAARVVFSGFPVREQQAC